MLGLQPWCDATASCLQHLGPRTSAIRNKINTRARSLDIAHLSLIFSSTPSDIYYYGRAYKYCSVFFPSVLPSVNLSLELLKVRSVLGLIISTRLI